ncbi:MAG: glutamine amidotransferase-related protein, partial [Phormidesmis sp.]
MILVIANYDSFTYTLVQYLGELGQTLSVAREIEVFRNDQITLEEIKAKKPSGIVISPGPGTPDSAGVSLKIIEQLGPQ